MKKSLIIVYSYHHSNTRKVADKMAAIINADILTPDQVKSLELVDYDIIGFGSGIDSGHHYKPLLDCVKGLQFKALQKVFIFSTSAVQGEKKVYKDHSALRGLLEDKACRLTGEFSCKGYNTNSF